MIVHQSELGLFLKCEMAHYFRFVQGLKIPPGIAARRGSGGHAANALNMELKIETRQDLPLEALQDTARDEIHRLCYDSAEGVFISKEDQREGGGARAIIDKAKDEIANAMKVYHAELAPPIQPILVEESMQADFRGYQIGGRLDTVSDGVIHDLKIQGRKNQEWADRDIQPTFYSLLFQARFNKPPDKFVYEQIIPNKTPVYAPLTTTRGERDFDLLERYLENFSAAIEKGNPKPADPHHWMCSPKWCGYWLICEYGGKGKSQ